MIKALLKKQILESLAGFVNGRDGKRRSTKTTAALAAVIVVAFASLGFIFYEMGNMLCAPMAEAGLAWVYFAFMGAIATAFGVIGSIFMAKSTLYEAKDNDLLFSMPIPAWLVLFSRMVGLYFFTLLFEALIFLPASLVYFIKVEFSATVLVGALAVQLLMPLGTLAICCILGWALAWVAAKLPMKNFFTLLLSVAFFVLYFFVYSELTEYISYVLTHGEAVGRVMKTVLYPFGKLGEACTGDMLSLLLFALMFIGAYALVYLVIAKTYIRWATANKGGRKVKYKSKAQKQNSCMGALLKKELLRYTKNPMVTMNCILATIFLFVLPFIALFGGELTQAIREAEGADELFAMILALIVCAICAMNMISASSVSLEGESLWVLRAMPVQTEQVLLAKCVFHWVVTAVPAAFCTVFLSILYQIGVGYSACALLVVLLFVALTSTLGLTINLKLPNLHWKNELIAVKQSMSAVLSMFMEWIAVGLLVGGYFLFGKYLFACGYMLVCAALLLAVVALLGVWIYKRGKVLFERL